MKAFILLLFILVNGPAVSQLNEEWVRSFNGPVNGNDEALTHITDDSGNIYSSGKILGSGSGFDIYTVKYNPSGNILWERIYNGPGNGNDIAYSIALDNTYNVFVAGESIGDGTDRDFVLIKYNDLGAEQWNRRYNGNSSSVEIPEKAVTDEAGNVIITGTSHEPGVLFDIVTIKYNSEGDLLWKKHFNGASSGNDFADDMALDESGNIYVSGSTFEAATINDYLIIKYSSAGDELWHKTYNGTANGNDNMTSIAADVSGNAVITGTSVGAGSGLDIVTIKYSPSGDVIWERWFTTSTVNIEEGKAITSDNLGNIFVTGTSTGFSTSYDYMTIMYSTAGDLIWSKNYNGPGSNNFDEPRSIAADNNGNVYVAGLSQGTGTMDDIVIVKYNYSGNEVWVNRFNSAADRNDVANNISLDNSGNIIVSGLISGVTSGTDFSVVKFSIITNVLSVSNETPSAYSLSQNYPNPFNPSTNIRFDILQDDQSHANDVRLSVYDILGKQVAVLVNEKLSSGSFEVQFDASDLAGGIYFYRLETAEFTDTKSMLLLK
ncbi:MAG: SBBP repeat-containing protein [Ignavibacteria bacterium]|nr:SBBP repeat-containing protein [Ignavibacteria bacterium]